MIPEKKYQPISCVYYDFIEHYAIRKEKVTIVWKDRDDREVQLNSRILDTKTEAKVEFMLLEATQEWIRMDRIISLNEHKLADFQDC